MKNALFFLLLLPFAQLALAQSQPVQVPGSQLEEKIIRWIWIHRSAILTSCLNDKTACGRDGELKTYFEKMPTVLVAAADAGSASPLDFVREADRPDLFRSATHEAHRVAITESRPGAQIIFNRDRIGGLEMGTLVGILFHEFSHHMRLSDDSRRLPDQLGAAISQHFTKQILMAPLTELNHPNIRVAIFQQALKEYYDETDVARKAFNFAVFTDGVELVDVDLAAFSAVPGCDDKQLVIVAQKSSAPKWVVNSDMGSGPNAALRATSLMQNFCGLPGGGHSQSPPPAEREFTVSFHLDRGGRIDWSSVIFKLSEQTLDDYFDEMRTLQLKEFKLSAPVVKAGGEFELSASLKRTRANAKPRKCFVAFTGRHWPQQSQGIPVLQSFDSCEMQEKDGFLRVKAKTKFPARLQNGDYRIFAIQILTDGDPALLKMPPVAAFQIVDSQLQAPARIRSVTFPELQPLTMFANQPLENSAMYSLDQEFDLIVDEVSPSQPSREALSLDLAVQVDDELKIVHNTGSFSDFSFLLTGRRVVKTSDGYQLIYRVKMPRKMQALNVFGLWVNRILIQDVDLNWQTIEFAQYDHLILMDRLLRQNGP